MAGKGVQASEVSAAETVSDEALATWQTLTRAAWSLTNVRVGCKDVVPRLAEVAVALEALGARVADVQRLQTLEIIEHEMHTAEGDLAALQELLQVTEAGIAEILKEVWNRKKALRNSARE